jgi:class 3 adenylate cyclase
VNLTQRLQQLGSAGETVISEATRAGLTVEVVTVELDAQLVKGRDTPVVAYKILAVVRPPLAASASSNHSESETS